jgi:hypothetical protein
MNKSSIFPVLLAAALAGVAPGEPPRPPVSGVGGARFRVNDLAKAREFYTGVLGLQEKTGTDQGVVAFRDNGGQSVRCWPRRLRRWGGSTRSWPTRGSSIAPHLLT